MGYEYTVVIATDNEIYGTDIDWGDGLDEYVDEKIVDDKKTVYRIDWAKGAYRVVEFFLDEVVKKEADEDGFSYPLNETFGIIQLGEEATDIEVYGDYWDFDIGYSRSIDIY